MCRHLFTHSTHHPICRENVTQFISAPVPGMLLFNQVLRFTIKTTIAGLIDLLSTLLLFCLASQFGPFLAHANPTGGTVAQGTATFANSGSQLTINQTSANAYINWQSFNIAAGRNHDFPAASHRRLWRGTKLQRSQSFADSWQLECQRLCGSSKTRPVLSSAARRRSPPMGWS